MNKFNKFQNDISNSFKDLIKINLSPATKYRSRSEFAYNSDYYVMFDKNKNKIELDSLEICENEIYQLMPIILNEINQSSLLKNGLFQINFRASLQNEVLITLIYRNKICENICSLIKILHEKYNINFYLRSKNELKIIGNEYLVSHIPSLKISLIQKDNTFFQPNKYLLENMIAKSVSFITNPNDLLELYCGIGTFSIPMSNIFNRILATENNRTSYKCLVKNIENNNISNIFHARLSDDEISDLFKGKVFRRMKDVNIDDFNFSHVLVDPPRSGLSENCIELIKNIENIIYISCNPESYINDINKLKNHNIKEIEIFDQFPNTNHLEIVSLLSIN